MTETAENQGRRGTPWRLGVACDWPRCGAFREAGFLVAEDGTIGERLRVVLNHAERSWGWTVVEADSGSPSDALAFCPAHKARLDALGFAGRDDQGRQFCLTCERWKFPATHSCPGVPQ
jgi:hypothetical protein